MYKLTYGNQKTHLVLTPKAQKLYDGTDGIQIFEYPNMEEVFDEQYMYTLKWYGQPEGHFQTEDELIADLEALQDEYDRMEADDE